jgi:hypothetical protein
MSRSPCTRHHTRADCFDGAATGTESLAESEIVAIRECHKLGAVGEPPDGLTQHELFGALAEQSRADLVVVVVGR